MERSKTKGGVSIEQNKVNGSAQSAEIVQRQVQSAGWMGVQPVRENLQTIPQDKREPVAIQLPVNIFDREAIRILYGQKDGASTVCLYLMLVAFAAKSNRGGALYVADDIPYDVESIASLTHMDAKVVQNALNLLAKYGLIRVKCDVIWIAGYAKLVQFKAPRRKNSGAKVREKYAN